MASGRGLNGIVLAQLGALNFFVWAVADSMSSTQLRTYTGIEYVLYMYNLSTCTGHCSLADPHRLSILGDGLPNLGTAHAPAVGARSHVVR